MSHIAESYVYQKDDGSGYVGRSFEGNGVLIGRRGAVFSDEDVSALGLSDLIDHTDYEAGLAEAKAKGAPITVRDEATGSIISVGGPDASRIVQVPHPNAGRPDWTNPQGFTEKYPPAGTMQNMTLDEGADVPDDLSELDDGEDS